MHIVPFSFGVLNDERATDRGHVSGCTKSLEQGHRLIREKCNQRNKKQLVSSTSPSSNFVFFLSVRRRFFWFLAALKNQFFS